MHEAVRTLSRHISGTSTLKLLLVGATCLFGGLIFLALINAMVRRPHAPVAVAAATAEAAPPAKVPARIIMPTQAEPTGSIPAPAAAAHEPVHTAASETAPDRVQPMIGRPSRSAHRLDRRARRLASRSGLDLTVAAVPGSDRPTWMVTTRSSLTVAEAEQLCADMRRHRVRCSPGPQKE